MVLLGHAYTVEILKGQKKEIDSSNHKSQDNS